MFCEYEVTLSMSPLMVTFGAGACACAMGTARARTARASIRTTSVLFITLSSIKLDEVQCVAVFLKPTSCNRATTVRRRNQLFFLVTPSGEKSRKTLDLFTANAIQGSRKKRQEVRGIPLEKTAT